MKKLKSLKNFKKWSRQQNVRRYTGFLAVLLLGAVLLFVVQTVYGWVNSPVRYNNDGYRMVMMLASAIKDTSKPAVIDPHTNKVYLPDASLVLPPYPDHQMEVRYSYTGDGDEPKSMQITTEQAVQLGIAKVLGAGPSDDMKTMFAQVPTAQACSRGLLVTLNGPAQITNQDALVFSNKLHDGRQMNVYEQNGCLGYDFAPLIAYLKDAKSY